MADEKQVFVAKPVNKSFSWVFCANEQSLVYKKVVWHQPSCPFLGAFLRISVPDKASDQL